MALSRHQTLKRLSGLEGIVEYHLDDHIPNGMANSPQNIPHWRTEVSGVINEMERLAGNANLGKKTAVEWQAKCADLKRRLTDLLGD